MGGVYVCVCGVGMGACVWCVDGVYVCVCGVGMHGYAWVCVVWVGLHSDVLRIWWKFSISIQHTNLPFSCIASTN